MIFFIILIFFLKSDALVLNRLIREKRIHAFPSLWKYVLTLFHTFKESFEIIIYNSRIPDIDPKNNLNYEPGIKLFIIKKNIF